MAAKTLASVLAEIKATQRKFYVYVLSRDGGEPFYVGVGSDDRIADHFREAAAGKKQAHRLSIIRQASAESKVIGCEIIGWTDDWQEALSIEVEKIARTGRRDLGLGPLTNLTDGGEGQRGIIRSSETRAKISVAHKGKVVSENTRLLLRMKNLGKKSSQETRAKQSLAMMGRPVSEETRGIISAAHKGRPRSPESIARMAATKRGKKLGPRSAETRARISASHLGVRQSEERRARASAKHKAMWDKIRAAGGRKLPHHKGRTPEGRAKHRWPIEISGIRYDVTDVAASVLGVGRTTIKRWLRSGHRCAKRLPKSLDA